MVEYDRVTPEKEVCVMWSPKTTVTKCGRDHKLKAPTNVVFAQVIAGCMKFEDTEIYGLLVLLSVRARLCGVVRLSMGGGTRL